MPKMPVLQFLLFNNSPCAWVYAWPGSDHCFPEVAWLLPPVARVVPTLPHLPSVGPLAVRMYFQ